MFLNYRGIRASPPNSSFPSKTHAFPSKTPAFPPKLQLSLQNPPKVQTSSNKKVKYVVQCTYRKTKASTQLSLRRENTIQ